MDYFNYPLDTKMLLRKKAKIRKQLLKQDNLIKKKIAVLGGSTTNEIVDQLGNFLLYYGISTEFYQSEYGQYWEDAVFGNPVLDSFEPDLIYIHTSWRNIHVFPDMNNTKDEVEQMLENEIEHFTAMWETVENKFHCPIIQNNFDRPNYRLMGNRDIWDYRGRSNYISRLNQKFYTYAQEHKNFYINDLEYISQDYGLSEWNNPLYWHMYKYAMCMDAVPYVAQSVAGIIKSVYGKNKKVLALDLDNTLWGGIIGDDGTEGIKIGTETPEGQVYTEFQNYCKSLQQTGVVLAVVSKNEMENAMAGLRHPDGSLKPGDFVDIKANWEPKDRNLREIADELALGVDSFVFVDDNPAERELVSAGIPDIAVPKMDGAENYIRVLDHSVYFEVTTLSAEDSGRTQMYHAKADAYKAKAVYKDYSEYLDSLEMICTVDEFKPVYIQRIAQLTNKSNQFNLTTLRCTENDIRRMQDDNHYICLCGRLEDKFGNHGLVSVVAGEMTDDRLYIRLWLMSCRVLKRELENAMMNVLAAEADKYGVREIIGYYYPTAKNAMVKDFFGNMGFKQISLDKDGNSEWKLCVREYKKMFAHMRVENQLWNK